MFMVRYTWTSSCPAPEKKWIEVFLEWSHQFCCWPGWQALCVFLLWYRNKAPCHALREGTKETEISISMTCSSWQGVFSLFFLSQLFFRNTFIYISVPPFPQPPIIPCFAPTPPPTSLHPSPRDSETLQGRPSKTITSLFLL